MRKSRSESQPKRDRSDNIVVNLGSNEILRQRLERLAELDALPGDSPNYSRTIRRLIHEAFATIDVNLD